MNWNWPWQRKPSVDSADCQIANDGKVDCRIANDGKWHFDVTHDSERGEVRFSDTWGWCARCEGVFSEEHGSLEIFWSNGPNHELIRKAAVKDWREAMEMYARVSANWHDVLRGVSQIDLLDHWGPNVLEQTFESGEFTANLYTNSRMDIFHNGEMWHMVFYVGCERTAEDEFKYQIGEDDDAAYGITDVVLEMAKLVPFPKEGASR